MASVATRHVALVSQRPTLTVALKPQMIIGRVSTRQTQHRFSTRLAWRTAGRSSIILAQNVDRRGIPAAMRRPMTLAGLPPTQRTAHFYSFARAPLSPPSLAPASPRQHPWPSISRTSPQARLISSTVSLASAPPQQAPSEILKKPLASLQSLTPHENIYTIPNILTFTRLLSAPLLGYLILSPTIPHIYALSLFIYAGLTDLLDGYLARRFNQFTVVGSVIDPMADKLLMTVSTFCLAFTGILPWWAATVIIGRDVALAISAIWWRWISLPPPKTMARYWDFSLPSAEVHPTEISKINTLLQLLLIGNAMVLPVLPEVWVEAWNLWGVFEGWCGLVAGTTVWSGLSYVGNKDAVKIVSQEEVRRVLEEREEREGKVGKEAGAVGGGLDGKR